MYSLLCRTTVQPYWRKVGEGLGASDVTVYIPYFVSICVSLCVDNRNRIGYEKNA